MIGKEKYIKRFKELYKRKSGKDISDQDAMEHFEKLIVLVSAVYQPLSRNFFDDGSCPHCKKPINFESFKDKLSLKEFLISGLCRVCQDEVFK
jgi:hypothetical protein